MTHPARGGDPRDLCDRLLAEAAALPPGPAQLAVYDGAVRAADTAHDVDRGFAARSRLMGAALEVGRGDVLSVAFAWCLAKHDEHPDRFPDFNVYWAFRWAISELALHPQFPRAQLDAMVADMARRYDAIGASRRPVEYLRMNIADDLGDRSQAAEALRLVRRLPRDVLSDDPGAERGFEVKNLVYLGREAEALGRAGPFLQLPVRDEHSGTKAIANLLVPLLKRGRGAEAVAFYPAALRACRGNPRHVGWYALFVRFLAVSGNLTAGLALFRKHLADAFEWVNPGHRFDFCAMATVLFDRLAAAGRKTVKLRPPAGLAPGRAGDATFEVAELRDLLHAEAARIAAAFDARNGTTAFADTLAAQPGYLALATDLPLP